MKFLWILQETLSATDTPTHTVIQPTELHTPQLHQYDTTATWYRLRNPEFSPIMPLTGSPSHEKSPQRFEASCAAPEPDRKVPDNFPVTSSSTSSHDTIPLLPSNSSFNSEALSKFTIYESLKQDSHEIVYPSLFEALNTPLHEQYSVGATGK